MQPSTAQNKGDFNGRGESDGKKRKKREKTSPEFRVWVTLGWLPRLEGELRPAPGVRAVLAVADEDRLADDDGGGLGGGGLSGGGAGHDALAVPAAVLVGLKQKQERRVRPFKWIFQ